MKLCPKCSIEKSDDQFYKSPKRPDGLSSYCRKCQVADAQARYQRHPRWRAPEGTKWCPGCESIKALDAFGNNRGNPDGRQNYCKPCAVAKVTASRHKDPTSHRRSSKAWKAANPGRHADNHAKRTYGIEHGTYATMLAAQGGRCAICGTDKPGTRLNRFPIDHCHDTGSVRGLLCSKCNQGIGLLNHDKVLIERAIAYLKTTALLNKVA